jgi:hypothetical protein
MLDQRWIFVALLFNLLGISTYIRRVMQRRVRPHIVTWALWALGPYIAFAAQISEHVGLPALLTFIVAFNPTVVVFLLLRHPERRWQVSMFDIVCAALALAGLGLWIHYSTAVYAVLFAVAADALAAIPTYRKVLTDPTSESWLLYACLTVSSCITLATIKTWSLTSAGFAAYLAVLGISLTYLQVTGQRRVKKPQPAS